MCARTRALQPTQASSFHYHAARSGRPPRGTLGQAVNARAPLRVPRQGDGLGSWTMGGRDAAMGVVNQSDSALV